MIGLKFLRIKLGYNGEKMAEIVGCDKSQLSRWESGKVKISRKYKEKIADLFLCSSELLGREINEVEEGELERIVLDYQYGHKFHLPDGIQEKMEEINSVKVRRLAKEIENSPGLLVPTRKWIEVLQNNRALANLILASIERYTGEHEEIRSDYEVTDYENNLISNDDPYVSIISSAMTADIEKKRK